jgi:hypothetical protein
MSFHAFAAFAGPDGIQLDLVGGDGGRGSQAKLMCDKSVRHISFSDV